MVARVDIRGATVPITATASLQARTSTGSVVGQVQIQPPSIDVQIPVQQALFRRTVAVTPRIHGEPAPGFQVRSIGVVPQTVVVVGTLEALEGAGAATTDAVLITDRRTDLRAVAIVAPPQGLALEEPGLTVIVSVSLAPFIEEAIFQVPVEITGVGAGVQVSVVPARVAVRVRGPAPDIAQLDSASFRVTVNAIGLEPGIRAQPIQVAFSGDLDIVSVTPREVTLLIELPPGGVPGQSGDAGSGNGNTDAGAR